MNGLVFGIDQGIASCGWAVLRHPTPSDPTGEIVAMGSWMFDVPETDKERTPTNQIRRGNRLLRRVIRRRAQRMAEIRRLFHRHGLLAGQEPDALKRAGLDPWELRARGLDKALSPAEFAVALGHIAKRRGFRSAKKGKEANTAGDDQKMLKALEATRERLGRYRTVGEMFGRDPDFSDRKRNRDGLFDRTQSRDDLIHEVSELFKAQRRLGNDAATTELEDVFTAIAFRQLEMQDSEKLVGMCQFEPKEKRTARFAPSFEKFRLLGKLVNLRVTTPDGERPLTPEEIKLVTADLGSTAKLTVKAVRKRIGLLDDQRFTAIKPEDEAQDIAARTGEAMHGTKKLRDALGDALWMEMQAQPELLDRIAHVISFYETADTIGAELRKLSLPKGAVDALLADLSVFSRFKGAGHISALAARSLIPHLESGLRYDQACEAVGYDHAASRWSKREQVADKKAFNRLVEDMGKEIANPIARKSLTEGLKQLWAMRNRWGLPDAVHIEMARDVGNSLEKRNEIKRNIDKNTAERERQREEVRELLKIEDVSGDTLLRYRLWKEQAGRCPYTDKAIPPNAINATDNSHQVDHILPWSRFGDDSYSNKVLCTAEANQRKKGQTPHEWIMASQGEDSWNTFVARIEGNAAFRGAKKRNYVLKNAKEAEERFRTRNLNDTRYASRLLAEAVKLFYPEGDRQEKGGTRRVYTRPGGLTAALRHAWGVESLKKVDGKRVDDARHHALDALVVAAIGEWEVQRLTRSFQEWEQKGLARPLRQVDPPWGDAASFRREVKEANDDIFVARPERRRARGEGHAATIRQIKERNGAQVVYERKSIAGLSEKRLADIKDPERNQDIVEAIRQWIADGRPADKLPLSPAGDEIRKVRLRTKGKPAIQVRGGTADRGEIARVDVFAKPNKRGKEEFYLVPIYPHHVMNKRDWPMPPMRAVVAYKDEEEWTLVDGSFAFRFSLHPRSYIEVIKPTGEILSGYFQGLNRSTGAINLSNHKNSRSLVDDDGNSTQSIGAKTLLTMKKYNVDRFGARSEVKSEVRTWHGVVCTSQTQLG
ncbi:type II CRISPR RNA-guided endonuclease Cas9 [Novosphingobium mangrovi (ex Huang et al. 2023)]|uniref:CRISPR-associated endonuclease Cas9 n=1 Tax=Novosphingobium mangrovi (ex Huang et al. 2023) TaxID=2976432 RepID=A0ABT2I480_9SPHN|nr:type II CRISPR RNA-guided endonuclease Cas9 [Novosphingobium mangrovi (ex Huang et al. 2023)]MCT2399607.1 type II CRISPR RNA-guided endonuclease Cas9 [Novosphingobium mangrovi (ex Huang et al. 2023)]